MLLEQIQQTNDIKKIDRKDYAALAVRSLWKKHRGKTSSCGGDCSRCKGCH